MPSKLLTPFLCCFLSEFSVHPPLFWVGAVLRAGLLVLPASAHAGGAAEAGHATIAIKPVSVGGDVKARLWGVVSVAKLAPDLAITCEDSVAHYPWKIGIVSTVFWVGETGRRPG